MKKGTPFYITEDVPVCAFIEALALGGLAMSNVIDDETGARTLVVHRRRAEMAKDPKIVDLAAVRAARTPPQATP